MSQPVVENNSSVTGNIISTTIGGENGEPKQVETILEWIFILEFSFTNFTIALRILLQFVVLQ